MLWRTSKRSVRFATPRRWSRLRFFWRRTHLSFPDLNKQRPRAKVRPNRTPFPLLGMLAAVLLASCSGIAAEEIPQEQTGGAGNWHIHEWKLQTSLYTKHFDPDPNHVNHQKLIGIEAVCENDWLFGVAFFNNSFGQSTQLVYAGKQWRLFDSRFWYVKLMGGLVHGYEEPYEDKIPLNGLGTAPVILPSLGFRYRRVFIETNMAGTAAVTITAGLAF